MGNIAGIWTAECLSEMKMETSSSGMGSRPTSKMPSAPNRGCVKVKHIWRKRRDSVKLAVGHGTPRPVISGTGRRCATAFWDSIPLPRFEEFFHRIHPDDQAALRERFEKAIRDKADFEMDYRVVHPEKGIRDIHVVGHAVLDGSSNLSEFVGTVIDVTERKRAEEERERLRQAVNEQFIKAQEAERVRIAGELHDGVLQQITSLTLRLGTVKRQVPPDSEVKATIGGLQRELIQIGTGVRHLSHELHPALLQEAGLPAALSSYCEEFSKVRGLPVECETDESVTELSPDAALCLYRIAQEALGNAAKYSQAKKVEVRLKLSDSRVSLSVSDDGVGCDPSRIGKSGGLGVINMRERVLQLNGTFEFDSEPGRGTTVRATILFRTLLSSGH